MPDIDDLRPYDGPLGPAEPRLAERRIAVATDPAGRLSLIRPNSVIVELDDDDLDRVASEMDQSSLQLLGGRPEGGPVCGVVGARDPSIARAPTARVIDNARRLADALRKRKLRVRANHVFLADGVGARFGLVGGDGSAGTPAIAPPTELDSTARPAIQPRRIAEPLGLPGHRPPHVLVLDSGLRTHEGRPEHPALTNCRIHEPWLDRKGPTGRFDDEDEPDDDRQGQLDTQGGHGTFISGIIRQRCPDAVVHHAGVLTSFGDGDHASIAHAIGRALRRANDGYDVVVLACGTYADGDDVTALQRLIDRLPATCVVVASAGNDSTSRPYFPAALPDVIGVGALGEDGRAPFSNFGGWVDACATGVDVVSTFFCDFEDRRGGRVVDRYQGWARWSGTSFAAPHVAAAIAHEQYLSGGTARDAWRRLTAPPRYRLPDLGVVVTS